MKALVTTIGVIILIVIIGYESYQFSHHVTNQTTAVKPTVAHKSMNTQPTVMASNSVYKIMPSGTLGPIFTDTKGMTLYTYKEDVNGTSRCLAGCLKAWPAYIAPSQTGNFPANIGVIKRTDGKLQYTWKEKPLYYYANDKKAGNVNGEGIGGIWAVVK